MLACSERSRRSALEHSKRLKLAVFAAPCRSQRDSTESFGALEPVTHHASSALDRARLQVASALGTSNELKRRAIRRSEPIDQVNAWNWGKSQRERGLTTCIPAAGNERGRNGKRASRLVYGEMKSSVD